jgi:hypothetical protein
MPKKKLEEEVPKIAPLPGYLRAQYIKCGRSNCHCNNSNGHGPYYYRVVTVGRRKQKKYVKKSDLAVVKAGINERHRRLAQVRSMNQEANLNWRLSKTQLRQLDQLLRLAGYNV